MLRKDHLGVWWQNARRGRTVDDMETVWVDGMTFALLRQRSGAMKLQTPVDIKVIYVFLVSAETGLP